ncbi:Thiamine biosynthetic bifunctional enzyme [Taphrina deformans PYCC 5710]|uniref:Thiamine biosynthetic bifunctional enzyme n=1 Tax=Taphrina deformans (strain PYCC 5710 / ATCC 11124 / CBS 356.35 / IMI 108563 / JCM 9778 / NBRC 8474) TaxID=1097556 RepID=R4X9B8_TAPDE|nr:Thiamine biosynthetic bifunctional enzyme [Taphrina deformans PYCC 5710]|eukprot:CCG82015.1 Thiamine biosynthetic bifunctional enzyme [Taphrina deformans PYCC 5710]
MKTSFGPNTLYLVTDSDLLHKSAISLNDHVEKAIRGGVDVVQLREKEADTGEFITKARSLLEVCRKYTVPLIINDRVDVALAVGADGLHVGQDDMNCAEARKLLGPDLFIGVSVNSVAEAKQAVADGADYLGIGAVYDTQTKALTKPTMGTSGVQEIIQYLSTLDRDIGTVAIGGINASNIERIMFASSSRTKPLDGIALVSAIMTSSDPEGTCRRLKGLLTCTPAFDQPQTVAIQSAADLHKVTGILAKVVEQKPLIQQMTNNVVKNFSANVTIAVGASPAMSEVRDEATDFAQANGAFLLNMGMVSTVETPIFAVQENNRLGKPCVLDPVGAGASTFRRRATKRYLDSCYFDVLKGNESEIRAAAGLTSTQRGVDNVSTGTVEDRCDLAKSLATRLRNIVVITGTQDIVSNGVQTVVLSCGHAWLGEITGSGCSLGSTVASLLAVNPSDKFSATVSAVLLYGLAAELAAGKDTTRGPGTFVPAFIDALWELSHSDSAFQQALQVNQDRLRFY